MIELNHNKCLQLTLHIMLLVTSLGACTPIYEGRPTAFPTQAATSTLEPSPTLTSTPAPTSTMTPTPTLTATPTLVPTPTSTYTPTPIPTRLANLPVLMTGNQLVDWSYYYPTRKENREDGALINLSGMVAFQLMDRGIHSETVRILGEDGLFSTSASGISQHHFLRS